MNSLFKRWWEYLAALSVVLGIMGIGLFSVVSDPQKVNIALSALLLLFLFIAWQAYKTFNEVLGKTYLNGYHTLSTFVRYSTSDGQNIQYETFRHIQNKVLVRDYIEHQFHWTGSVPPTITSCLQEVGNVLPVDDTAHSKVRINFKKPILFNEVEVVHIRMALNDSDRKSQPYVGLLVREPTKAITFKVELLHAKNKYNGASAKILKGDLDKNKANPPKEIDTVKFDATSKSFEYILMNPTPGYRYLLEWERKI